MDRLDFWLTTFTLGAFGYGCWLWFRNTYLAPNAPTLHRNAPNAPNAPVQQSNARPMHRKAWVQLFNARPQQIPHLLIVGPTGSGKTTFTRSLLTVRVGEAIVVTPKPDDPWGNLPIITIDDSGTFTDMQRTFAALDSEVKRRLVASKRGEPTGIPLTVVIDDAPVGLGECGDTAISLIKLVARLGRSFNVRLVLLSQSTRVESLGIRGEGDLLSNLHRIDIAKHQATTVLDGAVVNLDMGEVVRSLREASTLRPWPVPMITMDTAEPPNARTHERTNGADTPETAPNATNERTATKRRLYDFWYSQVGALRRSAKSCGGSRPLSDEW